MTNEWTCKARYFEYSKAANPIAIGATTPVPPSRFSRELYEDGATRVIPLDESTKLKTTNPATSPALLANFVRINTNEKIETSEKVTSQLFYIIKGKGSSVVHGKQLAWKAGDFITLPFLKESVVHHATEETIMYWVHDSPLMQYLGVTPTTQRFEPTLFPKEVAEEELRKVRQDPEAKKRSRVSVLLANAEHDQTLTITHVLWAMFGFLEKGTSQPAHRHQSVALDLILECKPGCYSLMGEEVDENGEIKNPVRVEWEPYSAFITPPGMWHSHHNESDGDAHLIPIQDAGLQTYLRSLDIQFTGTK
jgi:gentisate 1,2-dioxygenase